MNPTLSTHDTTQTVLANYQKYALLVLHPDNQDFQVVLAQFIREQPCPIYFYRLDITDTEPLHLLTNMVYTLCRQAPQFGSHVLRALNDTDEPQALAEALVSDLSRLEVDDFILIIDEFDRANKIASIQAVLEHLIFRLPSHCHLLINSRTIPVFPWTSFVARGLAAVVRKGELTAGH